jgi:tetratricopeptide (TPR) repeat protein
LRISKIQLIAISAGVLLTIGLFGAGYKVSTATGSSKTTTSAGFDSFLKDARDQLSSSELNDISLLEKQLTSANTEETQVMALKSLVKGWDSLGRYEISAHYAEEIALKSNREADWMDAGNRYFEALRLVTDSASKIFINEKTITLFKKVLELNPANLQAKNNLGISIVEQGNVMEGVRVLKEVETADPDNIPALYTLGYLSIQSGQLDKAAARFEKLVSLQPSNPQYHYHLGEIYEGLNQKDKAIRSYETCKMLLTGPEEIRKLENKILELKNT